MIFAAVVSAAVVLPAIASATPAATSSTAQKCDTTATSDFNGDGRSDLAVSAPGAEDIDSTSDTSGNTSGDVTVFAGGLKGLNFAHVLDRKGADTYPQFGAATAVGDFNRDGCADLVVMDDGGPSGGVEYPGGVVRRGYGAATIEYGHPDATKTALFGRRQLVPAHAVDHITKSCNTSDGCPIDLEPVVATADVNGDGYDDVVIVAAASGTLGPVDELAVIPGSKFGLRPGRAKVLAGDVRLPGTSAASRLDQIAAGDIDGDRFADVAVGFSHGTGDRPGVDVLFGARHGLGAGRAGQLWDRATSGVPGVDRAGSSMSVVLGDFRGNGHSDLAFAESGSPKVTVVYATKNGPSAKHVQTWTKDSPGIEGSTSAHGDEWGSTLVAGRFGIGRYDDLVVGDASTEALSVLRGSRARGLIAKGNLLWSQDTDGIPGRHEIGNLWGGALTVGYFGHGLGEDLAIGAPGANNRRGTITVLYGSKTSGIGLRTSLAQPLLKPSVNGTPAQPGDEFGAALPAG